MQTLTVDVFVSVDGYAGSATSPAYFGYFGPMIEEWIHEEMAGPQLVLVGRRTYEALAGLPGESGGPGADPMPGVDKVVFSSTLKTVAWQNTRVCQEDLIAEVTRLKSEGHVPLRTMGSLSLARQLLDAGLVDRLRLMTFPLLVGKSGREPFFAGVDSTELELVAHHDLDNRVLMIEYRPTGRAIPQA
ncbi:MULTISPECIES: dihydrofolate reductase family protein [unclassified Streptomyces]|uniref:dihydrofolate reductase family protein n=1 Tax=unclassified Streptomyces TaxID=2593676 RepID=UPI002DDB5D73|nr:dihydrofolate reductase family protein [Streptomyces sp. NBC_01445]WSE09619.1 dihydrofolate reductase family protein [Streptomyces sp. NBC_01445]